MTVQEVRNDGRPFIRPAVLVSSSPSPILVPVEASEPAATQNCHIVDGRGIERVGFFPLTPFQVEERRGREYVDYTFNSQNDPAACCSNPLSMGKMRT